MFSLAVCPTITLEELSDFIPKLFSDLFIVASSFGNLSFEEAKVFLCLFFLHLLHLLLLLPFLCFPFFVRFLNFLRLYLLSFSSPLHLVFLPPRHQ